ncbi:DUF6302 family protein [Streptomyces sp. NPDC093223]|uniref:DUF6302 family protein n=1 Tax=Streptomyces sp. NPDC093223 TaxID=3366033 RepID=UPI00382D42F3
MTRLTPRVPGTDAETGPGVPVPLEAHEDLVIRERLADPSLVDWAVEVALGEDESAERRLAVPLGGDRVAGQITVTGWSQALRVLLALDGRGGFPDLRDQGGRGDAIDDPRTISWGLNTNLAEPDQRARMWGYHDVGRRAYEAELTLDDARIPVTPLPDPDQFERARVAGIYDVLLDGMDNYLADRRFVQSLPRADADALTVAAIISRLHMRGVIGRLAAHGIDQFLDLGCGVVPCPSTSPDQDEPYTSLQDIVSRHHSTARLVYADYDPYVFGASRTAVEEHPLRPEWVQGDIRLMRQFLASGRVRHVLDWRRPIGVLVHDVLPWIGPDETVSAAMTVLRDALPPGSAVSIVHATDLGTNRMSRLSAPFRAEGITFRPRDAAGIEALFGGWCLEPPGLVPPHLWDPAHPHANLAPNRAGALAGLAYKPLTAAAPRVEEEKGTDHR